MRKIGILLLMLLATTTVLAQDKMSLFSRMDQKNILNHMDIGVNVGTVGIGIDVAVPVGDYVRIRAGYNYMPRFNLHSNFPIETRSGGRLSSFINKIGNIDAMLPPFIDLNLPYFTQEKELMEMYKNGDLSAKDYVGMDMKPNLHQFKFLVDVMPFKNNKHWSFTAGFFVGPSTVGEAINQQEETAILKAVNLYNNRYYHDLVVLHGMSFTFIEADGSLHDVGSYDPITNFVISNGLAGFPLGYFSDGKKAMMVPGADNTVRAEMKVNKFRPYLGVGYNTHLSRNKKWKLNVDLGVLFLCGSPKVYVDNVYKFSDGELQGHLDAGYFVYESGIGTVKGLYPNYEYDDEYYGDIVRYYYDPTRDPVIGYEDRPGVEILDNVDLVHDLHDIPGKVGNMVNTISKFKVYPNLSVTFSYRLY
jgi:hypothetical protein